MSEDELTKFHEPRFQIFSENKDLDLLAIETVPGLKEGRVLLRLLKKYKRDGYISFPCRDGTTNAGEPFEMIVQMIKGAFSRGHLDFKFIQNDSPIKRREVNS